MPGKSIISAKHLTKTYKLYNRNEDRVKEIFHPLRRIYHTPFNALNRVSFEVEKGEILGIIGVNGSGKSTLLQILAGVLSPTSGDIKINGRVSALLELGAGFNPEFTGRENIFMNASLLGMDHKDIHKNQESIIQFAEIGRFIDQPIKTYSSGMTIRLAFSIAISVEPEILVVDEALSVGDIYFQHKCMNRMKKLMDKGITIIFVSHDMGAVRTLCTRAMLMEKGRIIETGDTNKIVNLYSYRMIDHENDLIKEMSSEAGDMDQTEPIEVTESQKRLPTKKQEQRISFKRDPVFTERVSSSRAGSGKVRVQNVELYNTNNEVAGSFLFNDPIRVRVHVEFFESCTNTNIGFVLFDKNGVEILGTNCVIEGTPIAHGTPGDCYIVDFKFQNIMKHGSYSIQVGIGLSDEEGRYNIQTYDWVDNAAVFRSEPDPRHHIHSLVKIPIAVTLHGQHVK